MPSKWLQQSMNKKYEDHRKRVKEARPTIDVGRPPEMPLSMRREIERKRQQSSIEFDNRLLLDRLGLAMSKKNIDNDLKKQTYISFGQMQRKKQLQKLCVENNRLLDRIQNTVPSYHHEEWEREAEKRVEYLRNMTEFPHLFHHPSLKSKSGERAKSAQSQRDNNPNYMTSTGSSDLMAPPVPLVQTPSLKTRPVNLPSIHS